MRELSAIEEIVERQREFFLSGETKEIEYRTKALKKLKEIILAKEKRICEALKMDLNKSTMESYMTEVGMTLAEITYSIRHIRGWAKDQHVLSPLSQFHAKSFIKSEPYGVTLIMSPWNYPFLLCMEPMIGAIAAGNCCILKPSNYSQHTSAIIREIIEECYTQEYVTVIEGGREENTQLLEQKFDYIFFTGGVTVGKLVMEKAAQHLTPVTLELGGKSPCIIDKSANLKMAAKRIVFGKFLNSGQTCVAPDYALVQEDIKDEFIRYVSFYTHKMFGKNPFENENYPKMINQKHYQRVLSLIEQENVVFGGYGSEETLQIAPTLLTDITAKSPVMQEEIFGPVLPIISYKKLEEAERFVLVRPKPLACYIFTTRKAVETRLLRSLSFGGGCINDTIIHLASSRMGFGGVGGSGMGSYHGKVSFDTFSHRKSIVKKYNWIDLPFRYQPYTKRKESFVRMFLR